MIAVVICIKGIHVQIEICPSCGEELAGTGDAYCVFCHAELLDEPLPEPADTDTDEPGDYVALISAGRQFQPARVGVRVASVLTGEVVGVRAGGGEAETHGSIRKSRASSFPIL